MSRSSSNLRVFVNFKEDTVFAGEDVECTIIFKNFAATRRGSERTTNGLSTLNGSGRGAAVIQQLKTPRTPLRPGLGRHASVFGQPSSRAGSQVYTENVPLTPANEVPNQDLQRSPVRTRQQVSSPSKRTHGRSVSIISIGSTKDGERPVIHNAKTETTAIRPSAHPQPYSQNSFQSIYDIDNDDDTIQSHTALSSQSGVSTLDVRRANGKADERPRRASQFATSISPHDTRHPSPVLGRQAKDLPSNIPAISQLQTSPERGRGISDDNTPLQVQKVRSQNKAEDIPTVDARTFSLFSNNETPRPSLDLYNLSNHSNETLVSEMPTQLDRPGIRRGQPSRQSSFFTVNRPPIPQKRETLMMGYVQVAGSFVLDGSLVNRVPFEEVKRKAVVGGQAGGGVVGITRRNRDSGFFGALNLGSIGESLGDLLGSGQPSSMKEMKDIAESDSIPLLATPKSILFVNLELDPGQSRSFSYKFKMPRGLPPSHRGRAMKVNYNIVVGTQRPGPSRTQAQQISQISVPFRLFGGVNSYGESLGHDLMSPYIILKEKATIVPLEPSTPLPPTRKEDPSKNAAEAADFQSYVDQLLDASDRDQGLLSPSVDLHPQTPRTPLTSHPFSGPMSRSTSPPLATPSARTLIDHAVRWAGLRHSAIYSPTTFNIARSSVAIAVLSISRSALRLGDLLVCVMDFSQAKLPCYAVEATLESNERVDESLAIRSPQSVERVTRRVWARTTECTVGAGRASWSFQVPVTGTPSFTTTGVGVEWCVRVEIVVGMQEQARPPPHSHSRTPSTSSAVPETVEQAEGEEEEEEEEEESARLAGNDPDAESQPPAKKLPEISNALLEVIEADERGALLAPKVRLQAQSFEVVIPLRVFGASVGTWGGDGGGAGATAKEASEDGLPV